MGALVESNGRVKVAFGYSTVTEISELYRAVAVTCLQKRISRVLIVIGDDEPAGERALRCAVTMMILAGIPEDFHLALVAQPAAAKTYRNAPRDFSAVGVATRLFDSEADAARWLDGANEGARRAA